MRTRIALALSLVWFTLPAFGQVEQSEYYYAPLDVGGIDYSRAIVADWNGDGRDDLITYREEDGTHDLSVFLQKQDGLLAAPLDSALPVSGAEPLAVYAKDLNSDGRAELIYITAPTPSSNLSTVDLLVQDSGGVLVSAPVTIAPQGEWRNLHFEDIDADNRLEILAYEHGSNGSIWLIDQVNNLVFSASQKRQNVEAAYGSQTPAFADIDGDGFVDFVASSFSEAFSGGPSYTFDTPIVGLPSISGTVAGLADIDGDELTDIVLTSGDGLTVVFQELGGAYTVAIVADASSPSLGQPVAVNDVDADGDADIVAILNANRMIRTSLQINPRLLEGSESLLIRDETASPQYFDYRSTTVADLNGDGQADLVLPIGGRPHVSYNRFGAFGPVDLATSVQSAFTFSEHGSTIDYVVTVTNNGESTAQGATLLTRFMSSVRVENIDIECTELTISSTMDSGHTLATLGYQCALPILGPGQNTTVNIKTRSIYESDDREVDRPPVDFYFDVATRVAGQVDSDLSNNAAGSVDSGQPGNYSLYTAPFVSIFANEASGQFFVFADREARSPNARVTPVEYRFDSATAADFVAAAVEPHILHQVGNGGTGRALIELVTEDGDEGSESLDLRIKSRRPGNIQISATIRDDLSELESSGVRAFEAFQPQYSSATRLVPNYEPVDGVLVDMDGDNRLDIVLATGDNCGDETACGIEVFLNSMAGFVEAPALVQPLTAVATDIAGADFNNDGFNDIAISDGSNLRIFAGDGNGDFIGEMTIASTNTERIASGDIDGNGAIDLVAISRLDFDQSSPPPRNLEIYRQSAEGMLMLDQSYRQPFGYDGTLSIRDVDADGSLDIVATNNAGPNGVGVRQNNGSNVFNVLEYRKYTGIHSDYFGGLSSKGAEIADLDGDGLLEILPFGANNSVVKFRNGEFEDDVTQTYFNSDPMRFQIADMNGDGLGDYVTLDKAGADVELPAIRYQQADGTFLHFEGLDLDDGAAQSHFDAEPLLIGDLDNDGRNDVVSISTGRGFAYDPHFSWIGYNLGPNSEMAVATRTSPADLDAGTTGSAIFRISNLGAQFDSESSLALTASTNVSVTGLFAATGTCGMARYATTEAACVLPPMEASGFVDVLVEFMADTAGSASLEVTVTGRESDASPADNTVVETFTVNAVTAPPPPPPPPSTGGGGGGGGTLSPLWIFLLLIISAGRNRICQNPFVPRLSGRSKSGASSRT